MDFIGSYSAPIFRARSVTVQYFEYEVRKAFRNVDNYLPVSRLSYSRRR